MSNNFNSYSYIFSSFHSLPNNYFQGYCFIDNNLILDTEGAEKYGKSIYPFNDGCYFTLSKIEKKYIMGVDSNGFNKIYYFNLNGIWAVSNSILELSKYLYSKGVKLTKNYSVLASLFDINTVSNQISTLATVFNEIKLLPHEAFLEVQGNKLIIKPKVHQIDKGYVENLKLYIDTWLSRIETILVNGDMKIVSEITGGIDSRVVYSLFYAAMKRLDIKNTEEIYFRSSTEASHSDDLRCANKVVERFYGKLNVRPPTNRYKLPSIEAYKKWKVINIGGYYPFYIPAWSLSDDLIHFGGGGGEAHNSQYGNRTLEEFAKGQKRRIMREYKVKEGIDLDFILSEYVANLIADVKLIEAYASTNDNNPLILHYKEFRNRYHAGRAPQYGRMIAPLASEYLNICSIFCEKDKLESRQILYDIMETLCPGLLIMPYDTDPKFPNIENLKSLTLIDYSKKSNPGRVYKNNTPDHYKFDKDAYKHSYLFYLEQDLNDFIDNYENAFFTDEFIEDAKKTILEARLNKKFKHPVKAASIIQILTYKMMLDYAVN